MLVNLHCPFCILEEDRSTCQVCAGDGWFSSCLGDIIKTPDGPMVVSRFIDGQWILADLVAILAEMENFYYIEVEEYISN